MNPFALPFVQTSLAASLLAGNALALLGAFILLRRVSFSGLAVAQMAALGTVAGGVLGHNLGGFGTAVACVAAGVLALVKLSKLRRVPEEAWVASLYVLGAALAVLALSKDPHGEAHALNLFFGNVLSLGPEEVLEAGGALALVAAALGAWFHRWVWLFLDPIGASVAGIRTGRWTAAFLSVFAGAMVVSIHLFGVLLAFAYLLLPAVAGLLLCRTLRGLFVVVPLLTTGVVLSGIYLSFLWDFPTGPFIAAELATAALAAGGWRTAFPR